MIRVLRADATNLREYGIHLKAMPDEDKVMRFGTRVTDYAIDQLMLSMLYAPDNHQLWIAREASHIVGWGHMARDTSSWELAVSVEHDHQNKGIGGKLIAEMLEWAKVHHIEEVYMHCIESNKRIQHLAAKHNLKTRERGAGERTAALEVPDPSLGDINAQVWKEHSQIMTEYADIRQRLIDLWLSPMTHK